MNNTQMSARVGLFFVIGLALIWVTFESLREGKINGKKGYVVVAGFSTLKQLKIGDEVRMAGVKIGAVESTRLGKTRAEAILRIRTGYTIARDSTATIAMAGLIGTNYISLDIGHPDQGTVADGEELHTRDAADLNQIISDLGNLGQELRGTLGAIGKAMGPGTDGQGGLFQKLDRLVSENSTKISATLSNLEDITAKIRNGDGTIGKLVNDPAAYNEITAALAEIRGAATEAKTFVANAQSIVDQVKSGKGAVGTLIYDEDSANNIRLAGKNLREITEKLNNPNSTFGQLITNDNLIRDAQATLRKVDTAIDSFSDSGPVSAVGAVSGKLF